ncbi:RNA methyltransferase, TrmH family member protein [Theileria equi strain WA]|uniref:RNA methyltransferase, TrmH family member protein n=1 Tax=Theileria equi strain WA TaxID=1537102 RepID=L0B034_THEEQ|nr:RNA methyltransferase, TrmH family member protein [Theileria equi strain WA]AFZ80484.1 RNA methyltransferase, TrmH family member protein [Theileria equi strain WA]|eukprot:XP_004830150.1 RNA methyltransferase, TrmH family member protein [Theileria equi strain WA]
MLSQFFLFTGNKIILNSRNNSALKEFILPEWIDNSNSELDPVKVDAISTTDSSKVLKKIRPFHLNQLTVFNSNPYKLSKTILKNPLLKHLWKLRSSPSYRKHTCKRLIINSSIVKHTFIHTDAKFDNILTTDKELIDFVLSNPTYTQRFSRIQLVEKHILQHCLRGTKEAYQVVDTIAEITIPEPSDCRKPRLVVAFDNIKYTNNLGSLIRTSLALNVDLLYYLKGTTEPFNWKVSSVTGGLQFLIPHKCGTVNDLKQFCKRKNLLPVVAHIEGDPIDSIKFKGKGLCIILGNESEGPDTRILSFSRRVALPMHPFMNSLNVSIAGAILIHQLQYTLLNSR